MKKPIYKRLANFCRKYNLSYIIKDRDNNNEPYLERFYIIPRWLTFGLFRIVIHRFWKSDEANALHDHPWCWASYILEGGYYEYTDARSSSTEILTEKNIKKTWRKPGNFSGFQKATKLHRVELKKIDQEVWTIFFMGPRVQDWGFMAYQSNLWIHWKNYLK